MKKKKITKYEHGAKALGFAEHSLCKLEVLLPALTTLHDISTDGEDFKDECGRTLILRGVNIPAKTPKKPYASMPWGKNFFAHRKVSFIDCPFSLEEADEHLTRLRYWGFTLIRLTVTWEAIEHAGPGEYDFEYLNYLDALVEKCERFGMHLLIDFHQDVWSRFTGGDGAPGWTVEGAGFSLPYLEKTGAAIFYKRKRKKGHPLSWATNASKLGAATMFTLFFGGNTFAPKRMLYGDSIQNTLQEHYTNSLLQVVTRLKGRKGILGFDIMNEPHAGYIGVENLAKPFGVIKLGATPTPFEGMLLGEGFSLSVEEWQRKFLYLGKTGRVQLNENQERAWQEGVACPWREAGVWGIDRGGEAVLHKPDYFAKKDFNRDFYVPFLKKVGHAIEKVSPKKMIFFESVIGLNPPLIENKDFCAPVFSLHWYDAFILVMQSFWSFLGVDVLKMKLLIALPRSIRKSFAGQLRKLKGFFSGMPTLISEFGIPFQSSKDMKEQNKALNRSFQALEDNLLSGTVWNYTANNRNHEGDHWNSEDLSIYSKDLVFDPDNCYEGARAKLALIRPYAMKTAGTPLYMNFDVAKEIFTYTFAHIPNTPYATEIFLPHLHFEDGFSVELSDGSYKMDFLRQILTYQHEESQETHTIMIKRQPVKKENLHVIDYSSEQKVEIIQEASSLKKADEV